MLTLLTCDADPPVDFELPVNEPHSDLPVADVDHCGTGTVMVSTDVTTKYVVLPEHEMTGPNADAVNFKVEWSHCCPGPDDVG